jgi:hypothetical protein
MRGFRVTHCLLARINCLEHGLEPTTDSFIIAAGEGPVYRPIPAGASIESLIKKGFFGKLDTVIYRDAECTEQLFRHNCFSSSRPTRRSKTIMYNCFRYALAWLPPKLDIPVAPPAPVRIAA